MKTFVRLTILIMIVASMFVTSCDNNDDLNYTGNSEVYEFAFTDTVVAAQSQDFIVKINKYSESIPDDWSFSRLGFDEYMDYVPDTYKEFIYLAPYDSDVKKIPNGLECLWVKVEKVFVDGEAAVKISLDENKSDKRRSCKISIVRYWDHGFFSGSFIVRQMPESDADSF